MACLVLHNLLHSMKDDGTWLQAEVECQEAVEIRNNRLEEQLEESNAEAKQAGIARRTELPNGEPLLEADSEAGSDAGLDRGLDGIWDAGSDAGLEAGAEPEAAGLEGGGWRPLFRYFK